MWYVFYMIAAQRASAGGSGSMDQWRRPSGEFEHADLAELGTACTDLSFELRERRHRTPAERLELADRVAEALCRAGAHLTPEPHGPATPENRLLRGAAVVEAFGQWHEVELRALRYRTIQRATLAALGEDAEAWLHNMGLPYDERRYWLALRSDADLVEQLRALEAEIADRDDSSIVGR
jgi:hypothetical protein